MGIEAVKLNRAQYRKRRRTMDELDASEMTELLTVYCLKQGVLRGVLYGAAYGLLCFGFGVIFGTGYGLIAGIAAGLLNGGVLSAINVIQRKSRHEERYFLRKAAYVAPILTALACYVIFHILGALGSSHDNERIWEPNFFFDIIPSLIAAFAAWQAARKMGDWYFE